MRVCCVRHTVAVSVVAVTRMGVGGRGDGGSAGISSENGVLGLASDSLLGSLESLGGLLGGICGERG
jgi:hypothetical protein